MKTILGEMKKRIIKMGMADNSKLTISYAEVTRPVERIILNSDQSLVDMYPARAINTISINQKSITGYRNEVLLHRNDLAEFVRAIKLLAKELGVIL